MSGTPRQIAWSVPTRMPHGGQVYVTGTVHDGGGAIAYRLTIVESPRGFDWEIRDWDGRALREGVAATLDLAQTETADAIARRDFHEPWSWQGLSE